MTKQTIFTAAEFPLNKLTLHPDNVRGHKGSYDDEALASLAVNIKECGLLQPLLVAPVGKGGQYGVLAGGRRLAALQLLGADRTAKGFTSKMPVACRVVPEVSDASVILSYSENALQLPMDALDRYEAFAAMRDTDGADVAKIARMFGIPERAVKEALRLGNVHADIRQAHRDGDLSLEALKGFDAHPDPAVQLAAFVDLSEQGGGRIQHWSVANYFRNRFVRVGDALGQAVLEGYKAAGGVITADLIEEDSVLEDSTLVEQVLRTHLSDAAEERRADLGLAWADYLVSADYETTSAYGRVYPQNIELNGETAAQADTFAKRMEDIETLFDEEADDEAQELLQEEYDALSERIDVLTTGYRDEDKAISGVIAAWSGRDITFYDGMVRPEDQKGRGQGEGSSGTYTGGNAAPDVAPQDKWSEALRVDMAHVRTRAYGLALAQSAALARDYADYTLISAVLSANSYRSASSTTLTANIGSRGPQEPSGSLSAIEEVFDALFAGLNTDWVALEPVQAFEAFRALSIEERDPLMAYAVAQTLTAKLAPTLHDPVRECVEIEALPNLRDVWTPDVVFLERLTKPALLAILTSDLAMGNEAQVMVKARKSELVQYLGKLFAAPFATLTDEQRANVDVWCPSAMQKPVVSEGVAPSVDADADVGDEAGEEQLQDAA